MRRMRWLMLAFLAVMALMAGLHRPAPPHEPRVATRMTLPAPAPGVEIATPPPAVADAARALPPEVDDTLALIASQGPFPYDRDGLVFGNFEGHLPPHPRGWYHEYTVPTPGVSHRGARRIVTGGNPPSEYWYTDDHYETFRRIER